ncbi:MAG: single-stranded-DNA-specific exonuclease RecJ, partial [Deltaproteobacteria bacterium]|nr:single-stranded-DNA-specific exonuclease RecJ [Deltaproteobacteria bacterium]
MKKHWQMLQPDPKILHQLSRELNCHPVTAAVLANRKITTASDAAAFLRVSLKNLRPPFAMIDIQAAVDRIYAA